MVYKLGSLFDGSGGFPLAGGLCGVEPMWAAEVEPYPIAVTRSRFPKMKHLGDISKVNGGEIEPVDIITFGSPCQDLSVAGKRAGLKHEANGDEETTRSGLFIEAVRIIKEMREATNGEYPSFALWENVPGAFSSNKGEDFRLVCEELIKIVEPTAVMPAVPKNGWPYADSYCGDGWSLAYRVFDAQYWGVPQRRRRIHLVLDLRGERAREVSFEREGVRGYFATGRTPWQILAAHAQNCLGADDRAGEGFDGYNGDPTGGVSANLGVNCGISTGRNGVIEYRGDGGLDAVGVVNAIGGNAENYQISNCLPTLTNGSAPGFMNAVAYTLKIRSGVAVDSNGKSAGKGALVQVDKAATLATSNDQYLFQPVAAGFCTEHSAKARGVGFQEECAPTLRAGITPATVYAVENHPADSRVDIDENGKVQTLTSRMGTGGGNVPMVMEPVPIHDQATRFSGKRGDKCDGEGNGLGVGEPGDPMNTLTGGDRHAVAYTASKASFFMRSEEDLASTLVATDYKDPQLVVYPTELHEFIADHNADVPHQQDLLQAADGVSRPLVAATHGAASHHTKTVIYTGTNYIVRRLTPTECARLQGFADRWGDIDKKDSFTPEEFQFWHEVRNTHAAINGKKVMEYTEAQMLTWYNKLHTDSAEYKMWGNGIALPPALYILQGMIDAFKKEVEDDWML